MQMLKVDSIVVLIEFLRTSRLTMQFWLSSLFIVVTSFFGLWVFSDSLPLVDEVTVYVTICHGERKNGDCIGKEEPIGKTTYKPMTDQQIVLFWRDHDAPIRLQNCAVRDVRNWGCTSSNGLRSEMIDGRYRRTISDRTSSPSDSVIQVPKWRWWLLKLNADTAPNTQQ